MVLHRVALGPEYDLLPDDSVEAMAGSMRHQRVIVSVVNSLTRRSKCENLRWSVGNQLALIIPRQLGQPPYRPSPDITIYSSQLIDDHQAWVNINSFGPPALAIEICNPTGGHRIPLEHDLETLNSTGKPAAYARAGIPEYLAFDPAGEVIDRQILAWRAGESGDYEPWLPDPVTGRWHSALGISFAPQGVLLRVYDPDGNIVPDNDDMDEIVAAQKARIAELEAELRRQRGE